jgi:raffinose/stachyose/melibiose transport system permease protein
MNMKTVTIKSLRREEYIQSYLMVAVSTIGLVLFVLYPLGWVLKYCTYSYGGVGTPLRFVGLENFFRAFTDSPRYWQAVKNTFIFAFGKLLVEIPLALFLAAVLARKLYGSTFFRTIFFLPSMLSVAVMGIIFYYLFGSYNGVVNEFIRSLGGSRISWFTDGKRAMLVLMITSVWQNFGLNMIFFLTGLQSIPHEMYEAATIDGANERQQFFRITIPMLGPISQMVIMNALLGSLKLTDLVLVMTNGMPNGKTEVMMSYIYKLFFSDYASSDWGYASSLMLITAVMLGIVTITYLRMTKRNSELY